MINGRPFILFIFLWLLGLAFFVSAQDANEAPTLSTWEKSGLIAEDLAIVLGKPEELSEERRARILLMAESAYRAHRNEPIWTDAKVLADFSAFDSLLESQGLAKSDLFLHPKVPGALIGLRKVIPVKDLHKTLRLADYCVLLRDGPQSQAEAWPKWEKGELPGEGNVRAQTIEMRQAFSEAMEAISLVEIDLPRKFIPQNWIFQALHKKYQARSSPSKLSKITFPSVLKPGWDFADAKQLAEHLVETNHLDVEELKKVDQVYSEPISQAVASLQKSLGLTPDGIIGPQTLATMRGNTSDAEILKLKSNLNRARLLPNQLGDRYLIANIPSGEIYGFEKDKLAIRMRIVFGAANEDHKTPFFRDEMTNVIFCPYWMLPNEISRNEYLPKIFRDRSYMSRNGYQIVDYTGKVYDTTTANLNQVYNGDLYLRQQGGSSNALGRVKFLFPNANYIYFHDTPEKHFFKADYRTQSHGCVRLQYPASMANWVLEDFPEWNKQTINNAMWSGQRREVKLYNSIPVYIVYFTMFPNPAKPSEIFTLPDYYAQD